MGAFALRAGVAHSSQCNERASYTCFKFAGLHSPQAMPRVRPGLGEQCTFKFLPSRPEQPLLSGGEGVPVATSADALEVAGQEGVCVSL